MDYLEALTEPVLREAFGDDIVDQAHQALLMGKVVYRRFHPPDELEARWDTPNNASIMGVRIEGGNLLMHCTCRDYSNGMVCLHLVALLTALVREPVTFRGYARTSNPTGFMQDNAAALAVFDPVKEFRAMLNVQAIAQIREIARRRSVPITGLKKEPIVDTLAQALASRDKFLSDWSSLSSSARQVAGLFPFIGSPLVEENLREAAQLVGIKDTGSFDEASKELQAFGMFSIDSYGWMHVPRTYPVWMPPDPGFLSIKSRDVESLRLQLSAAPRSFALLAVWLLLLQTQGEPYKVRTGEIERKLRKTLPYLEGWPVDPSDLQHLEKSTSYYSSIARLNLKLAPFPSVLDNDSRLKLASALKTSPEQLDFLLALLEAMDWLKFAPGKPVQTNKDALLKIVQQDVLSLSREFLVNYSRLQSWSDLDALLSNPKKFRFILTDVSPGQFAQFTQILLNLRGYMLLSMRRLPAGRWNDLERMAEQLGRLPFRSDLVRLSKLGRLEINEHLIKIDKDEDVKGFIQMLLESILTGPYFWLGMVDLAWEGGQLAAYRITQFGGALFGQPSHFEIPLPPGNQPGVTFSADGGITLNLETASSEAILLLTQLGKMEIDRQSNLIFRFQMEGAGRLFEAGWSVERILDALTQAAQRPPPEPLVDKLRQWWANFGTVQLYQDVALIELGDDYAFNELLSATSLSRYLLYRFSPRLLAIRPEGVEMLRDELVKKGYTPRLAS